MSFFHSRVGNLIESCVLFDTYRFLDMTFEDPTLLATQHMFGTGLTRYRQLDAAYKGDPVVPWRVVVRA